MIRTYAIGALIASLLFAATVRAGTVEHPGTLARDAECSSCHAKKISGTSVHSAMVSPCTTCHVARTQGDMTTLSLLMPKEQICYACHEKSSAIKQHVPAIKGQCVECHDAHSSDRRMLLREAALLPGSAPKRK